jgi:hypothetical protein
MNRKNFPRRKAARQAAALARHNGQPVTDHLINRGVCVTTDIHRVGKQNPRYAPGK